MKKVSLVFLLFVFGYAFATPSGREESEFVWQPQQLYSWLNKQKQDTVLINFWATWCKPCIEEMPDLLAVTQSRNIKSYFFSLDDVEIADKVQNFIGARKWEGNFHLIDVANFDKFINTIDSNWEGSLPMTQLYINGKLFSHYQKFENKDEIKTFLNQN